MSGLGHEDSFPPPKPGVRYANRKRTLAGMSRDDEDAPIPAIHGPHQPDANLDDCGAKFPILIAISRTVVSR